MTPEAIVRALAASTTMQTHEDGCALCGSWETVAQLHDHDCPWRLAVEWVAENPPTPQTYGVCGALSTPPGYGICNEPPGHDGLPGGWRGWHRETRDGAVWAEWRGDGRNDPRRAPH